MKKFSVTFILSLVLLAFSFTERAHAECDPNAIPTPDKVRYILRQILEPHVHSLHRSLYFYSWTDQNQPGTAEDYFKKKSAAGEGLFAAANPLSSIEYGGRRGEGSLLRIRVPEGFRYLDQGTGFAIPGIYSFKVERGLFTASPAQSKELVCYSSSGKTPKIPDLIQEVKKTFYLHFTIDSWRRPVFRECANYLDAHSEIIFSDPSVLSQIQVQFFPQKIAVGSLTPQAIQDYSELLRYFDDFNFSKDYSGGGVGEGVRRVYPLWAGPIRGLGPNTDWIRDRDARSVQAQADRSRLISENFGCSVSTYDDGEVPFSGLDEATLNQVVQLLGDEGSFDVPNALIDYGKKAIQPMLLALNHHNPVIRAQATYVLGRIPEPANLPAITRMLKDPDPKVRQAAVESVAVLRTVHIY